MVDQFTNIKSKVILYFHNDPTTMKGAKTVTERTQLLNNVDKIVLYQSGLKKFLKI